MALFACNVDTNNATAYGIYTSTAVIRHRALMCTDVTEPGARYINVCTRISCCATITGGVIPHGYSQILDTGMSSIYSMRDTRPASLLQFGAAVKVRASERVR